MAQPSIRDGYLPAGYEWLASILTAGLPDLESLVYLEVILQCHGFARLDAAELSPADIARRSGTRRENVGKAIRGLVAKGMLERVDKCRYAPVLDYERWDLGETGRRREARVSYVADAPRLAKSFRRNADRPGPPADGPRPAHQADFFAGWDANPTRPDGGPAPPGGDAEAIDVSARENTCRDLSGSRPVIYPDHGRDLSGSRPVIYPDHGDTSPPTPPIEERARGIENSEEMLRPFFEKQPDKKKDLDLGGTGAGNLLDAWQAMKAARGA